MKMSKNTTDKTNNEVPFNVQKDNDRIIVITFN